MSSELPPSLDPVAARRWAAMPPAASPWLHEEVARRMEQRLQWIVAQPAQWLHWQPTLGGLQAQELLAKRYPRSTCYVVESSQPRRAAAMRSLQPGWWSPARWTGAKVAFESPSTPVQMVWANMSLHHAADPMAVIRQWWDALAVDGFLMFSCLGPDTLRELREVYASQGWPQPSHSFTDMHDWGDMLVQAGFAEPVMDMETIRLSYSSAQSLLAELRTLGRNLNKARHPVCRGRHWLAQLRLLLQTRLQQAGETGRLELTFEVIYGHAFKPAPRIKVAAQSSITLQHMRAELGLNPEKGSS